MQVNILLLLLLLLFKKKKKEVIVLFIYLFILSDHFLKFSPYLACGWLTKPILFTGRDESEQGK